MKKNSFSHKTTGDRSIITVSLDSSKVTGVTYNGVKIEEDRGIYAFILDKSKVLNLKKGWKEIIFGKMGIEIK